MSMDQQIEAVLAAYHRRIEEERDLPGQDSGATPMYAVGPATGRFINLLAASLPSPTILELGTSFGYSGIWLAEAARATGGRLLTMEMHADKSEYAREMMAKAGLAAHVEFLVGDAVAMIDALPSGIDFVLLDLWKDLYVPALEGFLPKLNPGAI